MTDAERRRRVLVAVVLAGVAPPGGHVYLGRSARGFLLLAASVGAGVVWVVVAPRSLGLAQLAALPGLLLLLAVIVDAGLLARRAPDPLPERPLHRWWVYLCLAVLTQAAIPTALARMLEHRAGLLVQPDAAMEPVVLQAERIVFERRSGSDEPPARDELVVLDPGGGELLVRRVAGLPGEEVSVVDGRVRIDGADWIEDRMRIRRRPDLDLEPTRVGRGEVLVLGDRRRRGDRVQQPVPIELVVGRPTWILQPPGFPVDPQLGSRLGEQLR